MSDPPDDIATFMGPLDPAEYELRRRIRTARNAASFKATRTENANARTLCWMVTEHACHWIYLPAEIAELENVASFLRRLLIVADQAEALEAANA